MAQRRKDALTPEQIEAGRRMREQHGTSWYRIGLTLGCASEQIRYAIDTAYADRRREAWARNSANARERELLAIKERCAAFKPRPSARKPEASVDDYEPTDETRASRRRATRQDNAFAAAMTNAIRAKNETCPIGVETRPGTQNPLLASSRVDLQRSATGSMSQMCADFA